MYKPHLNFSDTINENIAESEMFGGVWFCKPAWAVGVDGESLSTGKSLKAQTHNTEYLIENRPDGTYVSGSAKFCPLPTKCIVRGCTWGGSMIIMGWIGRGMYLEFRIDDIIITTSEIQDVVVIEKEQ